MTTNTQWLEKRQQYVTASEVLSLLQLFDNPMQDNIQGIEYFNKTAFQMYYEKSLPIDMYEQYQSTIFTTSMDAGNKREADIARFAEADLGFELTANGNNLATLDDHKIAATPDYYAKVNDFVLLQDATDGNATNVEVLKYNETIDLSQDGLCECKLTWKLDNDKLLAYQLQVQQQLLCTGKSWGVIAIGIHEQGDATKITQRKYYFVKFNPIIGDAIKTASHNFWTYFNNIQSANIEAPEVDLDNERDKQLNAFVEQDIGLLCDKYFDLYEKVKQCDMALDALKTRLKHYSLDGTFQAEYNGTTYQIPIQKRKGTTWTQEAINKAKSKLDATQVGDIKTPPSTVISKPKIIS